MRRTLLPLAILLAAAIAAPAPALAGGHGAPAEGGEKGEKKEGGKKDKDDKKGGHKLTQSESYIGMDPLYTSIMDGPRPLGLLMVGVGLDIPDAELRGKAEHDMPRLRDAYVRALMSFTAVNVRSWRQPEVGALADRLQSVTDRVLGKKGAKILLGQVMIQLNN
jgi:flagellar basal body-associated protein FliL